MYGEALNFQWSDDKENSKHKDGDELHPLEK
jgi:hypothetical protein